MKHIWKTIGFLTLLLLLTFATTPLQAAATADSTWAEAMRAYKAQDFPTALAQFQSPLLLQTAAYAEAAKYFEGQAYYELEDFRTARLLMDKFIAAHPRHAYTPAARLLVGNMQYAQQETAGALRTYLDLYRDAGEDSAIGREAGTRAGELFPVSLTREDLRQLRNQYGEQRLTRLVDLKIADRYIAEGDFSKAETLIDAALESGGNAVYMPIARKLRAFLKQRTATPVEIAVLMPAKGPMTEQARMIYEGARLAVLEHNESATPPVYLRVEKFSGTAADAAQVMNRLAKNPSVLGVIGPVASNAWLPVAIQAHHLKLPVVMPLAQNPELGEYADYTFQIRTDYRTQGQSLAQYIIDETDNRRFGVVSSVSSQHQDFTEAFIETIDRLGGEIVSVQYYYPGTIDLEEQLGVIRESGLEIMFQDSLQFFADTLGFTWDSLQVTQIDSLKIAFRAAVDSLRLLEMADPDYRPSTGDDPLDQRVTSLDGFCLLADANDAPTVFSQYRYYNFDADVYGGPDWYLPQTPKEDWRYPDGLIFSTDFSLGEESNAFVQFRNRFRVETRQDPTQEAVQGYDAMRAMLQTIDNGAGSRRTIAEKFHHFEALDGAGGTIALDARHGSNTWVNILQINRGFVARAPKRPVFEIVPFLIDSTESTTP
jgi:ABC-type branched-subunit amino acid transport system substrate-binding protein